MKFTPEHLAKAKAAKSAEELLALAKENDVELTENEAQKYFAELHKEGALADSELASVSGGCGGKNEEMAQTKPPHDSKYKVGDTVWYDRDWYTVSAVWWNGSAWKYKITRYDRNMGYDTRDRFSEDELLDHVPREYM